MFFLKKSFHYIQRLYRLYIPIDYERIEDFSDDVARIQRKKDGKWNYINKKGKILSPNLWFKWAGAYVNGFAQVQSDDKLWNLIDKQGKVLSPNIWFKWVSHFNNGFAIIEYKEDLWNFIDTNGHIISPNRWFYSVRHFHENYACVVNKRKKWGIIDNKGKLVVDMQFNQIFYRGGYHIGFIKNNTPYVITLSSKIYRFLL